MALGDAAVLLVDLNSWNGHHGPYFKRFCRLFLDAGVRVEALCTEPRECREYLSGEFGERGRWHVHTAEIPAGVLARRHRAWHLANRFGRAVTGSYPWESEYAMDNHRLCRAAQRRAVFGRRSPVFFADLRCMLSPAARVLQRYCFPSRWAGLHITPCERNRGLLDDENAMFWTRSEQAMGLASCRGVWLLDEGVVDAYRARYPRTPFHVMPEPCPAPPRGVPPAIVPELDAHIAGRRTFGILGNLLKRKNLLKFLEIAARLDPSQWAVFVIGAVPEAEYSAEERARLQAFLSAGSARVFWREQANIPETTFDWLVSRMTVAYLCYADFPFSSNILAKAALARVPVIVSDGYLMAERVRRHALGFVAGQDDVEGQYRAVLAAPSFTFDEARLAAYTATLREDALRDMFRAHVLPALGIRQAGAGVAP